MNHFASFIKLMNRSIPIPVLNHGLCGSAWETAISNPPQNPTEQNRTEQDYVGGPYGCAKFGENPSMEASQQMGEI